MDSTCFSGERRHTYFGTWLPGAMNYGQSRKTTTTTTTSTTTTTTNTTTTTTIKRHITSVMTISTKFITYGDMCAVFMNMNIAVHFKDLLQ